MSFAQVLLDETAQICVQCLRQAEASCAGLDVCIEGVMTSNGSGYKKHPQCRLPSAEHSPRQDKTTPYFFKTIGKGKGFAKTGLREWACRQPCESSAQR